MCAKTAMHRNEGKKATRLCCLNGKASLQLIEKPPLIQNRLLKENTATGKCFKSNLNMYNSLFLMTSLGAEYNLTNQGFYTAFKVQGQCYHKTGGLLPSPDEKPKFIQVYFMGNTDEEARQCNRHVCCK